MSLCEVAGRSQDGTGASVYQRARGVLTTHCCAAPGGHGGTDTRVVSVGSPSRDMTLSHEYTKSDFLIECLCDIIHVTHEEAEAKRGM